jgi:hypothetical protein
MVVAILNLGDVVDRPLSMTVAVAGLLGNFLFAEQLAISTRPKHTSFQCLSVRSTPCSADDPQGDVRNQIEENYTELEEPHPAVVDDVKLLSR